MKSIITVTILLASQIVASARVGETLDQLVTRYAKPLMETKDFGQPAYDFEKADYHIHINLLNGQSACEDYRVIAQKGQPRRIMSQGDIDLFLGANARGKQWKTVETINLFGHALHREGTAMDGMTPPPKGSYFVTTFVNAWMLDGEPLMAIQFRNPTYPDELDLCIMTKEWNGFYAELFKKAREKALKDSGL